MKIAEGELKPIGSGTWDDGGGGGKTVVSALDIGDHHLRKILIPDYLRNYMTPGEHVRVAISQGLSRALLVVLAAWVVPSFASAADSGADTSTLQISEIDRVAIFKAAGAIQRKGKWIICDPPADAGAPEPEGALIETVRDLNGDGRPEAVVTDGGTYCYGNTGAWFALLGKQLNGRWRVITSDTGIAEFLKTKGADGWPDILVGGPGFCFPVQRWNGKSYALHRFEYEGRRCKPKR